MKRFLSIPSACALALSLGVTALAAESSFTGISADASYKAGHRYNEHNPLCGWHSQPYPRYSPNTRQ